MTREEAHLKVKDWIDEKELFVKSKGTGKNVPTNYWHYGKVELHRDIDRIFDSFEKQLNELNKQKICDGCKK